MSFVETIIEISSPFLDLMTRLDDAEIHLYIVLYVRC